MLSPYQASALSNRKSPVLNGSCSVSAARYKPAISLRVSWVAFTNCSKAATSAAPDKPRPNSVAENDVPSFSYPLGGGSEFLSGFWSETRSATDIGARDHWYTKEVS